MKIEDVVETPAPFRRARLGPFVLVLAVAVVCGLGAVVRGCADGLAGDGGRPRLPVPRVRMGHDDAQSIAIYLRSLQEGRATDSAPAGSSAPSRRLEEPLGRGVELLLVIARTELVRL